MSSSRAPRGAILPDSNPPRWQVALRLLLAIIGGYAWTSLATAFLARFLPLDPMEATIAATLASFLIYAILILWVVHTAKLMRALALLVLSAGAMTLPLCFSILSGGRL